MEIVAKLSKTWRNRQLMIAGFLAIFGLWFIYDGAIGWPQKNKVHAAYQQMKEEGRAAEWPEHSQKMNWPLKAPDHGYDADQIKQQFILAGVAFAGSVAALIILFRSSKRTMRADEEAAYGEKNQRVAFADFTAVDKKKWDSKGIAIAHYRGQGGDEKLVIDDYKFQGAEAILTRIEEHLGSRGSSDDGGESAPAL